MKKKIMQYREVINYLIFGVATTVVNFIVYFACRDLLGINYQMSIVIAWIISVLFAFYTNKYYVFTKDNQKNVFTELFQFYSTRLLTLGVELLLMIVLVEKLNWSDGPSKIIVQVIIILLNYVFSKLIVFKNHSEEKTK